MNEPALITPTPNGDQPARRLHVRPVAVVVQLEIVADDGADLHPIETRPVRIAVAEWPNWHLDVALAQLQAELDAR